MADVYSRKSEEWIMNKEPGNKFNEPAQYSANARTRMERISTVPIFHLNPLAKSIICADVAGVNFLSLIGPNEWNKEHIGTF
jgi:hypothetical protein